MQNIYSMSNMARSFACSKEPYCENTMAYFLLSVFTSEGEKHLGWNCLHIHNLHNIGSYSKPVWSGRVLKHCKRS